MKINRAISSSLGIVVLVVILIVASVLNKTIFNETALATAPATVINVVPVAADKSVTLTWTNPGSVDFTGTMVRYSTIAFPTSVSDGILAADVSGIPSGTSSTTVTGLSNGTVYYFSLFAHNSIPEYSIVVNAQQLVMAPAFTETFQTLSTGAIGGQNGWTTLGGVWNVADTSGEKTLQSTSAFVGYEVGRVMNGGTTSTYTDQMIRADWKGSTITTPGQVFLRAQSASADAGGYFLWQSGGSIRINYKTGAGSAQVQLAASSFTPVAGTWYTYEFSVVNNSAGLPVLTGYVWARGTVKPPNPTVQVTDTINRFPQGVFSVGKTGTAIAEYDNVTFSGKIGLSNVTVTPGNEANILKWTNPTYPNYSGTMVRASTTAFPTSISDGTLVANVSGISAGTSSTTHTGLTNGTFYYYAFFPYDTVNEYGTPISVTQLAFPDIFIEDFNTLNVDTVVGQNNWTSSGGTWSVIDAFSQRVLGGTNTVTTYPTNKAINGSSEITDQILVNRFLSDSVSNTAGYVWLRYSTGNNGYLVWHNSNAWNISYYTGGVLTTLVTAAATAVPPMEANVWFNQEVSVINDDSGLPVIRVYIWKDGTQKPLTPSLQATDSTDRFVSGSFALGKNNVANSYYDNVGFYGTGPALSIDNLPAAVEGNPNVATLSIVDENGVIYIPYIQTSTTLNAIASAGVVPLGGGVEFVLNEGVGGQQNVIDLTEPYSTSFVGLAKAEYTLDAYVLDSDGVTHLPDAASHVERTDIAIGDIITVVGDSVVEGTGGTTDTGTVTSWLDADVGTASLDNRNFPQYGTSSTTYNKGFLSDLNDKLAAYYGYPVFLMNEGRGGIRANNYQSVVMTAGWQARQLLLNSNTWIVMLGINDNRAGDSPTTFQTNLTSLLNTFISTYGATADTMWLPYPFYDFGSGGGLYAPGLTNFVPVIDTILNNFGLQGTADLFHTFQFYHDTEYNGNVHPNAIGYPHMARLIALGMMRPTVSVETQALPPTRPVTVSWNDLSVYESTIAGYRVNYGTSPTDLDTSVTTAGTSIELNNLLWGTQYYFSVEAYDNDSNYVSYSDDSVVETITTNAGLSGFTISAISSSTTEAGGTATFTIKLTSQPVADVTIPVSSSNTAEATVAPVNLTFTNANWNEPQTITSTGVDDQMDDGDTVFDVILGAATSDDVSYNGTNPADVSITNTDNDTTGITASTISGITSEVGQSATFTVVLTSQPTADVTIAASSSNIIEGTVSSPLTFTSDNWNAPQIVIVMGVDDSIDDGDKAYSIVLAAATSSDPTYNNFNPSDVSVTNIDNDTIGIIVSVISRNTTETGGTATFTTVLTSQPVADVAIPVSSSNTSEGTTDQSILTFTDTNWNVPQTVIVTGVDDQADDGDVLYDVILGIVTSSDTSYSGMNPADVSSANTDDEASAFIISILSGLTTEAGGTATFTVQLTSQPNADVIIPVASSNTTEATVVPDSLTFTNTNWSAPQTVTVTGVDDQLDDGDVVYDIILGITISDDLSYNGMNPADASSSNTDDDSTIPVNVAPVFNGALPNVSFVAGTTTETVFDLDEYFSDTDDETLTYTVAGNTNITAIINNGAVQITSLVTTNGTETVVFTAQDENGANVSSNEVEVTTTSGVNLATIKSVTGRRRGEGVVTVVMTDDSSISWKAFAKGGSVARLAAIKGSGYIFVVQYRSGVAIRAYTPIGELLKKRRLSPNVHRRILAIGDLNNRASTDEIVVATRRGRKVYFSVFSFKPNRSRFHLMYRTRGYGPITNNTFRVRVYNQKIELKDSSGNVVKILRAR